MFFKKDRRWEKSIKDFAEEKISLEEFLEINKNKILWYSTPFLETRNKQLMPNALIFNQNSGPFFPAFSTARDLNKHFINMGANGIMIKGNLKDALDSLDSHDAIKGWGLVVDPHIKNFVAFPSGTRIK